MFVLPFPYLFVGQLYHSTALDIAPFEADCEHFPGTSLSFTYDIPYCNLWEGKYYKWRDLHSPLSGW